MAYMVEDCKILSLAMYERDQKLDGGITWVDSNSDFRGNGVKVTRWSLTSSVVVVTGMLVY